MKKRIITLLMVLVMLVSLFPTGVLAISDEDSYDETDAATEISGETAGQDAPDTEGEEKDAEPEESPEPAEPEEPQESVERDEDPTGEPEPAEPVEDDGEEPFEGAEYISEPGVLSLQFGDTSVELSAPRGAFPEGARLRVYVFGDEEAEAYISVIEEYYHFVLDNVLALDISVIDEKGNPCKPDGDVKVSFSNPGLVPHARIWHFDAPIKDTSTKGTPTKNRGPLFKELSAKSSSGEVSVYTDSFSPYFVANTRGDGVNSHTVNFLTRDGEIFDYRAVADGEAIGELPDTINVARPGYVAYWTIGTSSPGAQGTVWTAGERVYPDTPVTEDLNIYPGYDLIEYTVTFYDADPSQQTEPDSPETVATRTVSIDTGYHVNNMPAVPSKDGHHGRWVYSGGDFDNTVTISEDTDVWAEYDQNTFTVIFMVNENEYHRDTYYQGDQLSLPEDPVVEGKKFVGWYLDETEYEGGEAVTSDFTLTAVFEDALCVSFIIDHGSGEPSETLRQYYDSGDPIGALPSEPFIAGKVFEKWVREDTGETVTAATVVTESFTVVAVFRSVSVYNITAKYYYLADNGTEHVFDTDFMQIERRQLPYTITAPATTLTDPNYVAGDPQYYYPSTPTVTLTEDDFDENLTCVVMIQFVPFTAEYDFVYMLKDLDGDGYTEIERISNIQGVLNSYVTPTIKNYEHYVLERVESAEITQAEGQELKVYYTRHEYTLSYDTSDGSYVGGGTYLYGETVSLTTTRPTRTGYTFAGWYSDSSCTVPVSGSVTIEGNTVIYAKWTAQNVNYTIIYMKEQYDNSTGTTSFVYENSRNANGQVGSTVYAYNAPAITLNGYEKLDVVNGTANSVGTGEGTAVTIAADGSTVLKVYYSLIRYTIVFNANGGTINIGGQTYTGSNYRIENVVIGQEIGNMWPASSTEIYRSGRYFNGWTGAYYTYITKQYELVYELVQSANSNHVMTFTADWGYSSSDRDAYYWLQQPDGTYVIEDAYTQIGLNTTNLGAKEIDGYTIHNGTPSGYPASGNAITSVTQNNNGNYVRDDNKIGGNNRTYYEFEGHLYRTRRNNGDGSLTRYNVTLKYTYNFYYDRAQYQIDYYYGSTKLDTKSGILFEANISTAEYNYQPSRPSGIDNDYAWGGWYADSALQTQYVFGTMPGNNLVLYARWIAPTYTVSFVMDGGTPAVEDQTVEKYQKVQKPANPTKDNYTFDGWYTSASGTTLFDWNTQITEDTVIYAHWSRNILSYTVHYLDENGVTKADDKVVTNPNFVVGQTIIEDAIAIAGYRPTESSKSFILAESGNEISFVYSSKPETTSYTVRYILDPNEFPGDIPVAAEKTQTGIPGDTASVIEVAAAVDYATLIAAHPELEGREFHPDATEKTLVFSASEENTLTFYYSGFQSATVTVNFVDMGGNPIAGSDTQSLKVGKTYTLARTPIAGWDLYRVVEGTSFGGQAAGTSYQITDSVAASGLTFTLFYQKKATITVMPRSKQYDGSALTLPENIGDQVRVEGLKAEHSLSSLEYTYANTDNSSGDGRVNAGMATVTPKNAVISNDSGTVSQNYYSIRYISGTLEIQKLNVSVRVEPDRWTGAFYDGTEKKTGFTNPSKGITDYVMISDDTYSEEHLDEIWDSIIHSPGVVYDESAAGLGYYAVATSAAGEYPYMVSLTIPDDPNYSVSVYIREGRLQILPVPIEVTTGSASKSYDGEPLTNNDASMSGLVNGETATVTATGSQTDVGTSVNTYEIAWEGSAKAQNYNIIEDLGTLTVTPVYVVEYYYMNDDMTYPANASEVSDPRDAALGDTVSVTADDKADKQGGKYTFDENADNVESDEIDEGVNETVLKLYFKLNEATVTVHHYLKGTTTKVADDVTATETIGSQFTATPVSKYQELDLRVDSYDPSQTVTVNANGNVITIYYTLPLTISAKTDEKTFDGTPLSGGYTVSGALSDDISDIIAALGTVPSITYVYESPFDYLTEEDQALITGIPEYYAVTYVSGTLTIKPINVTVTLHGNTSSVPYDGTEHTVNGYEVDSIQIDGEDTTLYTENDFSLAEGATATASRQVAGKTDMGLTAASFVNNNTNFDTVTFVVTDGYQEITKKQLTIKVDTITKVYDNDPSTDPELTATITGAVEGETINYTLSREEGQDVGEYRITVTLGDNPNYDVTVEEGGTFNITKAGSVTVTLHGKTSRAQYDGSEHRVIGYVVDSISSPLYTENDFSLADGVKAIAKRTKLGTTYMELTSDSFVNNNPNFGDVTFVVTDGWIKITPSGSGGSVVPPSPDLNYDDHFAYVQGYPDGTFRPGQNINRAEAATMIFRLLTDARQKEIYTTSNSFSDVDSSMWYNDYVSSMANGGYVNGYPDGSFRGGNYITRAEFVTLLVRFFRLEDVECNFKDVSPDHWAYKYIATATYFGWLTGYEDGTFRPDQPITRAEAVTVVNRMLERGVDGSTDLGVFKNFSDNTNPNSWYYYEIIEAANTHKSSGKRPNETWEN